MCIEAAKEPAINHKGQLCIYQPIICHEGDCSKCGIPCAQVPQVDEKGERS